MAFLLQLHYEKSNSEISYLKVTATVHIHTLTGSPSLEQALKEKIYIIHSNIVITKKTASVTQKLSSDSFLLSIEEKVSFSFLQTIFLPFKRIENKIFCTFPK